MILVDDRDGSRELLVPLVKAGLPAELDRLEFADVAFAGRGLGGKPLTIAIEFKKLGEAVQALVTERLQGHQIPGMLRTFDPDLTGQRVYLLIEGEWRTDVAGRLVQRSRVGEWRPIPGSPPASAIRKRLVTLATRAGITVWLTPSRAETVAFLADLYHFWTDVDLDEHKSHLTVYKPDLDKRLLVKPTVFRQVIGGLPGIGTKFLASAEGYFNGSIERAINAPVEKWAVLSTTEQGKTRHLGSKHATEIVAAIHKGRS